MLAAEGGELAQQLVLLLRQLDGRVDEDMHEQVAASAAAKAGHAVAGDLEDAARLHAGGDRQQIGPVERVELDLGAEGRLGDREVQRRDQIGAGPLEAARPLDAEMHVEIPRRAAPQRGGTCPGDAQGGAVVDARRYLDGEGPVLEPPALTAAVGAGRGDDLARGRCSARRRSPSPSGRGSTGGRAGSGRCPGTRGRCSRVVPSRAPLPAQVVQVTGALRLTSRRVAEDGICEPDLQHDLGVGALAARSARWPPPPKP